MAKATNVDQLALDDPGEGPDVERSPDEEPEVVGLAEAGYEYQDETVDGKLVRTPVLVPLDREETIAAAVGTDVETVRKASGRSKS